MQFELEETVAVNDAEEVLRALEHQLRTIAAEIVRSEGQITAYGIGPSPRTVNRRDTTVIEAQADGSGTRLAVSAKYQASALLGGSSQDEIVRDKILRVIDEVRAELNVAKPRVRPIRVPSDTERPPAVFAAEPPQVEPLPFPRVPAPERTLREAQERFTSRLKMPTSIDNAALRESGQRPAFLEPRPYPEEETPIAPPALRESGHRSAFLEPRPYLEDETPTAPPALRESGHRPAFLEPRPYLEDETPTAPPALRESGHRPAFTEPGYLERESSVAPSAPRPSGYRAAFTEHGPAYPEKEAPPAPPSWVNGPMQVSAGMEGPPPIKMRPFASDSTTSAVRRALESASERPVELRTVDRRRLKRLGEPPLQSMVRAQEEADEHELRARKRRKITLISVASLLLVGATTYGLRDQLPAPVRDTLAGWSRAIIAIIPITPGDEPAAASAENGAGKGAASDGTDGGPAIVSDPEVMVRPESNIYLWVQDWAAALRSRDPSAQASYYADTVDQYLTHSGVTQDFVMQDKKAGIEGRAPLWSVTIDHIFVESQTATGARLQLMKHVLTKTQKGKPTTSVAKIQLKLERVDGTWKIVEERQLS